jgi:hypothetical protein
MKLNVTLTARWQIKNNTDYKVTDCKRVVNSKTNKILNYNQRGYYISGRYYKKSQIRNMVELIPKNDYCPF